ncbi:hypothetical protein ACH0V9_002490 [Shigella flexneri]
MIWLTLVFASLLSVAGQLCQKQATCFVAINKRRKHIVLWLGLALAAVKLWHEPVSPRHWCGVAFIIGGIVILGSTV